MCYRQIKIKKCAVCNKQEEPWSPGMRECPAKWSPPAQDCPPCTGVSDDTPEYVGFVCSTCHNTWVLVEAQRAGERDRLERLVAEDERAKDPVKEEPDEVDLFFKRALEQQEARERVMKEAAEAKARDAASSKNADYNSDDDTEWETVVTR